jgi:hypothetical protein
MDILDSWNKLRTLKFIFPPLQRGGVFLLLRIARLLRIRNPFERDAKESSHPATS